MMARMQQDLTRLREENRLLRTPAIPQVVQAPQRAAFTTTMCFSCGKSGHAATRCPNLDESFPFMQPGWQAEKTPGGFIMIPPRVVMDRRWAKMAADPGRGVCLSGQ